MKALIVMCHPRMESFTYGIVDTVTKALQENGHEVTLRDLYKMNFNPVLSAEETIHIENGKFVRDNATFPEDVQIEMDLIRESDLLIYVYPVWWNGYPALMKGYIDRVFQHGFAYSFESEEPKDIFKGKKALFIHSTGQPQESDESKALTEVIKETTSGWLFNSVPVEVMDHKVYGRVPYRSEEDLKEVLDTLYQEVLEIK